MARLEIREACVSRAGERVLDHFNLEIPAGQVHALLGERRSGKGQLAALLAGSLALDSGRIRVDGRPLERASPRDSLRLGVGVLFHESSLIPTLTAAENVLAGRRPIGFRGSVERRRVESLLQETASRWGLTLDLRVPVRRLSKAEAAIVELSRALAFDPVVLVLDEPAGRFRADQMPVLYGLVREARGAGKAVLYAATTADEVFRAADWVSIVRSGRVIGTQDAATFDRESLVALVDLAYSFPESREDLVRKNIELLKYKRYNDELISNLPLGAVILDAEGRVTLANGVARTILGAAEGAPLGEALARLESGPRSEIVDTARQGRRSEWGKVKVEGGRTLSVMAFPFHDAAGGALGTILAVEDITEELATREYLAGAERASSIAELSAGVAHEVNNPLAIISNYVELLLMRPQEGYTSERLAIIRDEIKRIHRIVASLLPFARVGAACLQQVNLAEVARESLLLLSHEADRRGILLEADLPARPLMVLADPSRIKQVVINLVLNALEALPAGGRIGVTLKPGDAEGTVQLVVEDDGPGIAPARLGNLFKPFAATTKGPGHAGLGLSVCQHIAELHGGSIAHRRQGEKTLFTVVLPVAGPPGAA